MVSGDLLQSNVLLMCETCSISFVQRMSLTNPYRKKLGGVRSGDLAGHVMYGDPLLIHLAGNICNIFSFTFTYNLSRSVFGDVISIISCL